MPDDRKPPKDIEAISGTVTERVASEQPKDAGASDKALPEPTEEQLLEYLRLGEKGDGALFAYLFHGQLICCEDMGDMWFQFDGTCWKKESTNLVGNCVDKVAKTYETLLSVMELRFYKMDPDAPKYGFTKSAIKQLKSAIARQRRPSALKTTPKFALAADKPLLIVSEKFDADPLLLACKNGLISLDRNLAGEFRPAKPSDFIRRHCPHEWQGIDAACPEWEKFLLDVVGNRQEVVDFLQRLFGYSITGLAVERIFTMFTGEGSNGKTLLFETLKDVLGDYMQSIKAELLLDQGKTVSADAPTPTIMSLRGLRVAFASETDEHRRFSSSKVKWLSGNDTLVGRSLFDNENVNFKPSHTLMLLTNHPPHVSASDFAFWDRLRLINFPNKYVDNPDPEKPNEKQRDYDLPRRLLQEAPGIIAWLVRGLIGYYREGLNPPSTIRDATKAYQNEEDLYGQFVDEMLETAPGQRVAAAAIHAAFTNWYEKNISKKNAPKMAAIGRALGKKVHKAKVGGTVYYFDVSIRIEALDQEN